MCRLCSAANCSAMTASSSSSPLCLRAGVAPALPAREAEAALPSDLEEAESLGVCPSRVPVNPPRPLRSTHSALLDMWHAALATSWTQRLLPATSRPSDLLNPAPSGGLLRVPRARVGLSITCGTRREPGSPLQPLQPGVAVVHAEGSKKQRARTARRKSV